MTNNLLASTPMMAHDYDDPQRKLGRALVLLCQWGREARRRQAADNSVPAEDAQEPQEATAVIERASD